MRLAKAVSHLILSRTPKTDLCPGGNECNRNPSDDRIATVTTSSHCEFVYPRRRPFWRIEFTVVGIRRCIQFSKSIQQSEEQLDRISRDLAELKGRPKSELSKDAMSRVEKDIEKWAAEFATEKQKKKLLLERRRAEHDTSLEHSNALAREYLAFLTTVLRESIRSYSAASGHSIAVNIPEVPEKVFSDVDPSRNAYEGKIVFSESASWNIRSISDARSGPDVAPPWIIVTLLQKAKPGASEQEKGELLVRFSGDMKSFFVRLQQDFLLAVPMESGNSANYPTTEYEDRIRNILIRLVEFQLLQD